MNFYERQFLQAWEDIHYPPGPEAPEEPMMEPVQVAQAGGGAAFGVFPAMKSRASRTGEKSPAAQMMVPDIAAGATKGLVTGGVGMPGDIESLVRGIRGIFTRGGDQGKLDAFLAGLEEKTILPTSEDVSKWLDTNVGPVVPAGAPMAEQRAGIAKAGQFAGEMVSGPGTLAKGGKAAAKTAMATAKFVKPKVGEMLSDYMRRSGMTPELMAYHGTPVRFAPEEGAPMGRFRAEKIGTGEGAQAFGYGLYFAESPGVARNYQSTLSYRDMVREFRKDLPDDADFDEALEIADKIDPRRGAVIKALADNDWLGFDYPSQAITAAFKDISNFDPSPELLDAINKAKGSLYTADIPDEMVSKMLDWDKPLSEQPKEIQAIAKKLDTDLSLPGRALYNQAQVKVDLGEGPLAPAASNWFRDQGIPGIRYLDQGSRGTGAGTRNIVVFPGGEDQVKILKVE